MLMNKRSALAIAVDVAANGRASRIDRGQHHGFDRLNEDLEFPQRDRPARFARMNPRQEQRFISVDVSNASNQRLIKQCGLDWPLPISEPIPKFRRSDFQGIGTQRRPRLPQIMNRPKGSEAAESPWIAEHQSALTDRRFDPPGAMHVIRLRERLAVRNKSKLPRHAQMHAEDSARFSEDSQVLAMPLKAADRIAAKQVSRRNSLLRRLTGVMDNVLPNQANSCDPCLH